MRWVLAVATLAACHHARPDPLIVEVSATLPGASPDIMASSVATPLERALGQLPHVVSLTSTSRSGSTELRVAFEGEDLFAAEQAVQGALNRSADLLPRTLPAPPIYSVRGPLAGRYLVERGDVENATQRLSQLAGAGLVETCGDRPRELHIEVDPQALAATGVTLTDALAAVRNSNAPSDFGAVVIATRNGAPVHLRDVATVQDGLAAPACVVIATPPGMVELAIHAQTAGSVDALRASIGSLFARLGIHAIAVPPQRELHVELAPDVTMEKAAEGLRTAPLGTGTVVELRSDGARVLAANASALPALRRLPIVASAGDTTATVHVSGADPAAVAAAARAIADRLRAANQLVATRGLANQHATTFDIDRDAATRLGSRTTDIEAILAAATGVIASTVFTQTNLYRVTLRATSLDHLYVRETGGTIVPLEQVVRIRDTIEPVEVLHRGQFPDVDLEVHGDPSAAIGAVPAGVRVEID